MAFLLNNPEAGVVVTDYDYNKFTEILTDRFYKGQIIEDYSLINNKDLSLCSYSFVIKNISRYMSTLIMELQDSYTEQSLRYCVYDSGDINGYIFHGGREMHLPEKITDMMNDFVSIYTEITKLKDIEIKGRPKREHYAYGVLPEEARMILPVSVTTNMMITLDGEAMIGLFSLMKKYPQIFDELRLRICALIGPHSVIYKTKTDILNMPDDYVKIFDEVDVNKFMINRCTAPITRIANGGRISSNTMYDTEKGTDPVKDLNLANNIVGYGHTSISEHTHISYSGRLSIPGYQQLIRHRHHNVSRKNGCGVLIGSIALTGDMEQDFPLYENLPNPEGYVYGKDGLTIPQLVKMYYEELQDFHTSNMLFTEDYDILPLIEQLNLNCTPIHFNVSGNMLSTMHVMSHRICNNAQPEISNLYRSLLKRLIEIEDPNLQAYVLKYGLPSCVNDKCKEGKMSCRSPLGLDDCTTLR